MRPHAFAHERVGFITVRAAQGIEGLVLLAENYYPVADEDYLPDPSVGAMIGQEALRKALELALLKGVGVFHVHMHGLSHRLWFSATDLREQVKFIPDFFTVCEQMPHGCACAGCHGHRDNRDVLLTTKTPDSEVYKHTIQYELFERLAFQRLLLVRRSGVSG